MFLVWHTEPTVSISIIDFMCIMLAKCKYIMAPLSNSFWEHGTMLPWQALVPISNATGETQPLVNWYCREAPLRANWRWLEEASGLQEVHTSCIYTHTYTQTHKNVSKYMFWKLESFESEIFEIDHIKIRKYNTLTKLWLSKYFHP